MNKKINKRKEVSEAVSAYRNIDSAWFGRL
jgi:hypothetical protein